MLLQHSLYQQIWKSSVISFPEGQLLFLVYTKLLYYLLAQLRFYLSFFYSLKLIILLLHILYLVSLSYSGPAYYSYPIYALQAKSCNYNILKLIPDELYYIKSKVFSYQVANSVLNLKLQVFINALIITIFKQDSLYSYLIQFNYTVIQLSQSLFADSRSYNPALL